MTSKLRMRILMAVALAIGLWVMFGGRDADTVEPAKGGAATVHRRVVSGPATAVAPTLTSRLVAMLQHRVTAAPGAAALFGARSWFVPPPPPPVVIAAPTPPPAPTAPPLPYQYMGSYKPDGEAAVFFLTRGDRVYDVRIGDTIDNTYSIDAFNGAQLLVTYKPLNIQQQLATGGAQ